MKYLFFFLSFVVTFFIFSCKKKDFGTGPQEFKIYLDPKSGEYPEYSTFYLKLYATKRAKVWWTENKDLDDKNRQYVKSAIVDADAPLTIPVLPQYQEGDTAGVFVINVAAQDERGVELRLTEKYTIILVPYVRVSPKGGFFPSEITVSLGCNKPCNLFYTLDGSEPTEKSQSVKDGTILEISQDTTVKYFAKDPSIGIKSTVLEEKYFIDTSSPKTQAFGLEKCKCESGCDKGDESPPDVVRCNSSVTVELVATDDKSPRTEIFWSVDGKIPSDETESLFDYGGNTFTGKDVVDVPIDTHTILKFFSKDEAGNKSQIQTVIVLVGEAPFAYAEPPGGVYGKDKIPLDVKIKTIPQDANLTYIVSFPTGETSYSDICSSPCSLTLSKEGKNIISFRAFKGSLVDTNRREDYILDSTPPQVFVEPAECKSEAGPFQMTLKTDEPAWVMWKFCEPDIPTCKMSACDENEEKVNKGTSPVTGIVIDRPYNFFYCAKDKAGNLSEIKKIGCSVVGKFEETFQNQDNMDAQNTDASWGNGKLSIKRDTPEKISSLDTGGSGTQDIDVYGQYVFVIDGGVGVRVIDVSSISSPSVLYTYTLTGAVSLRAWGDVLFVATGSEIYALDIQNPRSIKSVGVISQQDLAVTSNQINEISIWGKYLIVSAGTSGIIIVEITNDEFQTSKSIKMKRVGGIQPSSASVDIFSRKSDISGNLLFVAEARGGLRILDIKDPSSPKELTSFSSFLEGTEQAISVKAFQPYVAVGTNNGNLYIIDIKDLKNPSVLSNLSVGSGIPINHLDSYGIFIILADTQGVKFVDIRDVKNPKIASDVRVGSSLRVQNFGNLLYVADANSGLFILKIAEISREIKKVQGIETSSVYFDLSGATVVSASDKSVKLKEVNSVFSPQELTSSTDLQNISAVSIWGEYLLVLEKTKLKVIKVYPIGATWVEEGSFDFENIKTGLSIKELKVWGNILIVGSDKGIFAVPLSRPSEITSDKILRFDVSAERVDIQGDRIFVGTGQNSLVVLRITQNNFQELLRFTSSGPLFGLASFGELLATSQIVSGFVLYDISQVQLGRIAVKGASPIQSSFDPLLFGQYIFSISDKVLSVLDISFPDSPREVISTSKLNATRGKNYGDLSFILGSSLDIVRFSRSKSSYLLESKATSKVVTKDLKVSIRDASVVLNTCETQELVCQNVGCSVEVQLSNNGGRTWIDVPPNAGFFPFQSTGVDLIWKVNLKTQDPLVSPEICKLTIIYRFGK